MFENNNQSQFKVKKRTIIDVLFVFLGSHCYFKCAKRTLKIGG